jgi:hydroxyethylthiazole kinase-like uncharacterized protein yjeF
VIGAYGIAEVIAAEHAHAGELESGVLMERASTGLASEILRMLAGSVVGTRVVIAVGSGNNGGDALFAGALLARRGMRVDAIGATSAVHLAGLTAMRRAGGRFAVWNAAGSRALVDDADVIIDGLVGIGATGALRGAAAEIVLILNEARGIRVAVDLPSGVDADTGQVFGAAFDADLTVTFGVFKPGHLIAPGKALAGEVRLIDIGIAGAMGEPTVRAMRQADVQAVNPGPGFDDHKYRRGVVGVAAGSEDYPGAALLCVGAALRGQAGMVQYLDRDDGVARMVVAQHPEVVASQRIDAPRITTWVCGPGFVPGDRDHDAVEACLRTSVPVVLDAGALAILAASAELQELVRERGAVTILTPHDGEFARLGGAVQGVGRLGAALAMARQRDAVVLLKGPGTVIAAPDGTCFVDVEAGPVLATAGSGDVLSGIIGALLARAQARGDIRGVADAARTAAAGCWLHGRAGNLAGEEGQPVTASALIDSLGRAMTSRD